MQKKAKGSCPSRTKADGMTSIKARKCFDTDRNGLVPQGRESGVKWMELKGENGTSDLLLAVGGVCDVVCGGPPCGCGAIDVPESPLF
jgi:hypothetical protein